MKFFFLFVKRRNMKNFLIKADVYISKKKTRSYSLQKTNFGPRLLRQNFRVYFRRMGNVGIFFWGVRTYLSKVDNFSSLLVRFCRAVNKKIIFFVSVKNGDIVLRKNVFVTLANFIEMASFSYAFLELKKF